MELNEQILERGSVGIARKGCSNHPDAIHHIAAKFCTHYGSPPEELMMESPQRLPISLKNLTRAPQL